MKMIETHHFTSDEKLEWWGYGEWVEEPGEVLFEYKGMECKVTRRGIQEPGVKETFLFGGHLCGYIRIPDNHPYHHKDYEDIPIDCHGGLTYGECSDKHWIGFDCAHCFDYIPSTEYIKKILTMEGVLEPRPFYIKFKDNSFFKRSYKNIAFCIKECQSIVDQLLALASHPEQ